ncbi:DNA topoisomerase 3-alpha, partial [Globisporangium splendens]
MSQDTNSANMSSSLDQDEGAERGGEAVGGQGDRQHPLGRPVTAGARLVLLFLCVHHQGFSQYNPVYEFPYQIQNQHVTMVVTSVTGHLMELEFDASYRPVDLFTAKVTKKIRNDDTQKKIEKTLMKEARQSQWLALWLDCDREGENIAFEVKAVCEHVSPRLRVFRARFSALIPRDIVHAVQNLGVPNEKLSLACDARSEIDLRIGAAFTRFQTLRIQNRFPSLKKEKGVISYGPCQFPTLGFVVERFLQIQNFEKETFYHIDVTHRQGDQRDAPTTTFKWKRDRVFDRMACLCIYESLVENPIALIESIEKKPTWKRKPLPLTTVELQKRASRWLRVSSEQTMKAAESLYNKGFLSYPRTETNKFKEGTDLMGLVKMHEGNQQWGQYVSQQLLGAGKYEPPRQGGADDQAHPPIHPTKSVALSSISDDTEKKVYEFVTLHFLACCSKDAKGHQTNVQMRIVDERFTASGLMIVERNYLDIYKYEKWNASAIPVYQQGDTFEPSTLTMIAGETAPPPLLSEADLISKMDSNGIGTDATIAEHIKTILKREYAEKVNDNTQFKPTTLGLALVVSYEQMGLDLAKPALRAAMENDCKAISLGQKDYRQVVQACMNQMKEIFLNVNRNADVLDQTFAEHFNQPVSESNDNAYRSFPNEGNRARATSDHDARSNGGAGPSPYSSANIPQSSNYREPPTDRRNHTQQYQNAPPTRVAPPQAPTASNGAAPTIPRCSEHGLECVEREVVREGPNTGRHFFACPLPQGQQCDHFSWADAPDTSSGPVVKCSGHDEPCNERVVKKEGPNKGRSFYSCRHDQTETCGFFLWKDEAANEQSRAPSGTPAAQRFRSQDSSPAPQCPGHSLPCVLRTTRKQGDNYGREFYVCAQPASESCGYFVWKDEVGEQSSRQPPQRRPSTNRNEHGANRNGRGNGTTSGSTNCECGLPGVLLTCRNGANKGRTFYKCPNPQDQQCGFFEWAT